MTCDIPYAYTLVFSGTNVGDTLYAYLHSSRRATDLHVRHNLWASQATVDGRYPAVVWEHKFTVFKEQDTPHGYVKHLFDQVLTLVHSDPLPLAVHRKDNDAQVILFGSCYLQEHPKQTDPTDLLLHAAGIYNLGFIGTSDPTVVASP